MRSTLQPTLDVHYDLTLTEPEAKALEAIAGYNIEDFLNLFYKGMGRAYLEPYEQGLRCLFAGVRNLLPGQFDRARQAKIALGLKT